MNPNSTNAGLSRLSPHLRECPVPGVGTLWLGVLRYPDLESLGEVENKSTERFAEPIEEIPDDGIRDRRPLCRKIRHLFDHSALLTFYRKRHFGFRVCC